MGIHHASVSVGVAAHDQEAVQQCAMAGLRHSESCSSPPQSCYKRQHNTVPDHTLEGSWVLKPPLEVSDVVMCDGNSAQAALTLVDAWQGAYVVCVLVAGIGCKQKTCSQPEC